MAKKESKPKPAEPTPPLDLDNIQKKLETLEAENKLRAAKVDQIHALEIEWEAAKEKAKLKKDQLDNAHRELVALCCPLPLFDPESQKDKGPIKPEGWRDETLRSAGVPENICKILEERDPPMLTIGAIVDWQTAGKELTDLPKIGPGKAEKIADALERFWAEHPQACPEPKTIETLATATEALPGDEELEEEADADATSLRGVISDGIVDAISSLVGRGGDTTIGDYKIAREEFGGELRKVLKSKGCLEGQIDQAITKMERMIEEKQMEGSTS